MKDELGHEWVIEYTEEAIFPRQAIPTKHCKKCGKKAWSDSEGARQYWAQSEVLNSETGKWEAKRCEQIRMEKALK